MEDTNNSVYRDFHRAKRQDPNNFATRLPRSAADEQEDTGAVADTYSDIAITKAKRPAPDSTLAKVIAASVHDDNPFSGMTLDPRLNPTDKPVRGPDGTTFSYGRK
jgi:hypothetical protein